MRRIHSRQQHDVGGRVSSRKIRPASWLAFDSPDLHPTPDPSRHLRSAQSGHLHQKTTHDSFLASTDTAILLRFQNPFDELINRFPLWCGKADASTPSTNSRIWSIVSRSMFCMVIFIHPQHCTLFHAPVQAHSE